MTSFEVETIRRLKALEDGLARLKANSVGPEWGALENNLMLLPALRGLWLAGDADQTGAVYDASGQQRTLTYNGNPKLFRSASRLQTYWIYDGTGDFHSRASEAGLQITGTEAYVNSTVAGLTMGGWFLFNDVSGTPGLMGKRDAAGNQRAYLLELTSSAAAMRISSDGTSANEKFVAHTDTLATGQWYFIVARFTPSTEMALWVNGVKVANTTSIPASIFATSTAAFQVGAFNAGTNLLTGLWANAFLCAAALTDGMIDFLWLRSHALFGV